MDVSEPDITCNHLNFTLTSDDQISKNHVTGTQISHMHGMQASHNIWQLNLCALLAISAVQYNDDNKTRKVETKQVFLQQIKSSRAFNQQYCIWQLGDIHENSGFG